MKIRCSYKNFLPLFFIFSLLPGFCLAHSSSKPAVQLSAEQISSLAQSPQWWQLLHYNTHGISTINSDTFFLAANGKKDPQQELTALIEGYSSPEELSDRHPRCLFPARYYWLFQKFPEIFPLSGNEFVPKECKRFYRWSLLDQVQSLSLMLVSGYMGNPASIFGHSFLKINVSGKETDLFDLSISYGALVPENELIPLYILRGLFGGYQAGFSDKYFYNQDQVYSHTEFRDIWEYTLHLSPQARAFILMQLWEIIGKKQDYYFLNRNCAWHQAVLLDTVIDQPLARSGSFWYLPVETFFRLTTINEERQRIGEKPLLSSVTYHPSRQRLLIHYFKQLSSKELVAAKELIFSKLAALKKIKETLKKNSYIKVLNACLYWYQYQEIAHEEKKEEIVHFKDRILLELLKEPAQKEPLFFSIKERPPPTQKNPPQYLGAGFVYSSFEKEFLVLQWSPFTRDLLGNNNLEGDELVVFDTEIGIGAAEDALFLSRLDFIRARKSQIYDLPFNEKKHWSWQLRIATEKEDTDQDFLFFFAAGKTIRHPESPFYLYSQLGGSLHLLFPYLRIKPELGLFWDGRAVSGKIALSMENKGVNFQTNMQATAAFQWHISSASALCLDIENKNNEVRIGCQIKIFW